MAPPRLRTSSPPLPPSPSRHSIAVPTHWQVDYSNSGSPPRIFGSNILAVSFRADRCDRRASKISREYIAGDVRVHHREGRRYSGVRTHVEGGRATAGKASRSQGVSCCRRSRIRSELGSGCASEGGMGSDERSAASVHEHALTKLCDLHWEINRFINVRRPDVTEGGSILAKPTT